MCFVKKREKLIQSVPHRNTHLLVCWSFHLLYAIENYGVLEPNSTLLSWGNKPISGDGSGGFLSAPKSQNSELIQIVLFVPDKLLIITSGGFSCDHSSDPVSRTAGAVRCCASSIKSDNWTRLLKLVIKLLLKTKTFHRICADIFTHSTSPQTAVSTAVENVFSGAHVSTDEHNRHI